MGIFFSTGICLLDPWAPAVARGSAPKVFALVRARTQFPAPFASSLRPLTIGPSAAGDKPGHDYDI